MKKIKVFQNGVYLRDVYPHANWFQVLKYKLAQFIGKVVRKVIYWLKLATVTSVAFALGAFIFGNYTGATTKVIFAEKQDSNVSLFEKVEEMKNDLVNEIAKLEGPKDSQGLIVIDDNKAKSLPQKDKVSIGCMQFKVGTVQHYQNLLYKKNLTNYEATLLALDCEKAKEFAKEIIFETQGGLWNWSVATKEMGAKVQVIKELIK